MSVKCPGCNIVNLAPLSANYIRCGGCKKIFFAPKNENKDQAN